MNLLINLNKLNYPNLNAENAGDEPLLLNKYGHVYISNNRSEAINNIIKLGYDAVIMDDGFQDLSILKNINVLCFDSKNWLGNKNLIPSGPLREPVSSVRRADFIIIKGGKNESIEKTLNPASEIYFSRCASVVIAIGATE